MDPKLYAMLVDTFKNELNECHQELIDALLALEKVKNKDKKQAQEIFQTLFRVSHNVKGSSKSVGIDSISAIAHQLEDLFDLWREKTHIPSKK